MKFPPTLKALVSRARADHSLRQFESGHSISSFRPRQFFISFRVDLIDLRAPQRRAGAGVVTLLPSLICWLPVNRR